MFSVRCLVLFVAWCIRCSLIVCFDYWLLLSVWSVLLLRVVVRCCRWSVLLPRVVGCGWRLLLYLLVVRLCIVDLFNCLWFVVVVCCLLVVVVCVGCCLLLLFT